MTQTLPAPNVGRAGASTRSVALATYVFAVIMANTTLPTPLYAIYAGRLHLKPLMITVIFAVYAVGVLVSLLLFGRLSDHIGRRPVIGVAMALTAASALVFIASGSLPALLTGRVLSGLAAGLVTGAATAYVSELHHDRKRGSLIATIANMGGLGCGPLISGVLAAHAPRPTQLPYIVGAALLLPALFLLKVPDTVEGRPGGLRTGVKPQRLGVPREIRGPFAAAAISGFIGFVLLGFTTALVGNFLGQGLGDHSHQTAGIVAFLVFAAGSVGQLMAGRVSARTASLVGLAVLPVGLVLITVALPAKSLALFLVGAMIGGGAVGFALRAAILNLNTIAPPDRRGEVLSTFFVVAYIGITLPVVGTGLLLTTTTLLTAIVTLAAVLTTLAAIAAVILVRLPTIRPEPAAQPR
ncbi:MAG TPA: MFS transporter [Acidothermaceae bacterium]